MSLRSFRNLKSYPAGKPLSADDVLEFHAARLLLLLHICGANGEIDGLTKLAKLDFFVRYPAFFVRTSAFLGKPVAPVFDTVETPMVRHHYGPWDHRYYHVLAYLEGTGMARVRKAGARKFVFSLTEQGTLHAKRLSDQEAFRALRNHMIGVRKLLGRRSGESLKKLIYEIFAEEIVERPLGEEIR